MYSEDDLLPLSALQHLLFCERQCALIHIEQAWAENRLTAEGRILHEHVHEQDNESRGDVKIGRGLRLRSMQLGLAGIADVVEFHRDNNFKSHISNFKSDWRAFPVEYKRGRPKPNECDKVQLCAQAMCLEEMLDVKVETGAIFYGQPRRRLEVPMDPALRSLCVETAERLHRLFKSGQTPSAVYEKKCKNCSLFALCMPETAGRRKSAVRHVAQCLSGQEPCYGKVGQ